MQNTSGADKRERKKQIKYKEETDIFLADSELGEAKRLVRSQGASDLIELGQLRPGVQPEAVAGPAAAGLDEPLGDPFHCCGGSGPDTEAVS